MSVNEMAFAQTQLPNSYKCYMLNEKKFCGYESTPALTPPAPTAPPRSPAPAPPTAPSVTPPAAPAPPSGTALPSRTNPPRVSHLNA